MVKEKIFLIGLISLLLITAIVISGCVETGSVIQDTAPKCREEQVPYTEEEEYTEQEPYTDRECTQRKYDAKGGYLYTNYQTGKEEKYEWLLYSLFMIENGVEKPNLEEFQKYYITNYEDRLGTFRVKINYADEDNNYLESFIYHKKQVGPKETETGYISFSVLWKYKPGQAHGFWVSLDKPTFEECKTVTKYRTVIKTRTVTKYRTETVCE